MGIFIAIIGVAFIGYGFVRAGKVIIKEKRKAEKDIKVIAVTTIGVIVTLIGLFINTDFEEMAKEAKEGAKEIQAAEEDKLKPESENDLKSGDFYQYIAEKVAGTESSHGLPRVESASYNDVNGNTVTFKMNGDSMTKNLTKVGILKDSTEIMENMKVAGYEGNVIFVWFLPLENQYGEVDNIKSLAFTISKETFNRIDFNNFLYDNIPDVADEYFEHDVLKK